MIASLAAAAHVPFPRGNTNAPLYFPNKSLCTRSTRACFAWAALELCSCKMKHTYTHAHIENVERKRTHTHNSGRPLTLRHTGRPLTLRHSGRPLTLRHSGRPLTLRHSGRPLNLDAAEDRSKQAHTAEGRPKHAHGSGRPLTAFVFAAFVLQPDAIGSLLGSVYVFIEQLLHHIRVVHVSELVNS